MIEFAIPNSRTFLPTFLQIGKSFLEVSKKIYSQLLSLLPALPLHHRSSLQPAASATISPARLAAATAPYWLCSRARSECNYASSSPTSNNGTAVISILPLPLFCSLCRFITALHLSA